jgi:hypothetical protein
MSAVAQKRRADLLIWAQSVEIRVALIPADLRDRAEEWYAWRAYDRGSDRSEYSGIGVGALIAYARHNCTNYEALLCDLENHPGCAEAYPIVKERVNGAVRQALDEAGLMNDQRKMGEPVEAGEDVRMIQLGALPLPGFDVLSIEILKGA